MNKKKILNRIKSLVNFLKTRKGIAFLLVIFAVFLNAVLLWPEVATPTTNLNDEVLHLTATQEASSVLQEGKDPTDFWLPQIGLGFPLFHHYQHLPHAVLAVINQVTSFLFPLSRLFDFSRYLLLVLFPLSIFLAMRRFGFNYLAAGFSALISSLLSTYGLFGFDYLSYLWRGYGLYPQLWAMFFLPLALAEVYQTIRGKSRLFWAIFLSTIVLLSHVFYGYILFLSSIIFVFLSPNKKEIFSRLKKLILIFVFVGLITSYFALSLLPDLKYTNRSLFLPSWKYDSLGAKNILSDLFSGKIFDFGRFPSLTILFFLSLILFFVSKSYKKENYRLLFSLTIFWLLLSFGRPTWGFFLNVLPFSNFLQFIRFIGGFHLFAIMFTGAGCALVFERVKKTPSHFIIFLILIFIVILSPVYIERLRFYEENSKWRFETQQAFSEEKEELSDIKQTLGDLPRGRIYAGLPATWGNYPYYRIGHIPFYAIFPQWGMDSFGYAYHSEAFTDDLRLLFDDTKPEQYNLFNIRYVLLHQTWTPPSYYSRIKEFENYVLYEVPTTGYFDLVDAPAVFYGEAEDVYYPNSKWLFSSLPELKQHPILEIGDKPEKTYNLPVFSFQKVDEKILDDFSQIQPERGKILNEEISINKYEAQFEAKRDCYLILKTNYHPGWQVYLDDEEVSPVMLAPGFIGLKVESGIHQVVFLYKSPFYRIPLLIFGVLILLSIIFYQVKISRKRRISDKAR